MLATLGNCGRLLDADLELRQLRHVSQGRVRARLHDGLRVTKLGSQSARIPRQYKLEHVVLARHQSPRRNVQHRTPGGPLGRVTAQSSGKRNPRERCIAA